MKLENKKMLFITILCISSYAFSQTGEQAEGADTIDIPDVSTTIGGIEVPVDTAAIPDFSLILPESEPDFLLSLELPNPDITESDTLDDDGIGDESIPSAIAIEGIIGGGYPGYFVGDFSIFQNTGKNPFEIRFSHDAQNGMGTYSASEGYNKTETNLYGSKTISFAEKYILRGSARYNTGLVGLQGKTPDFYNSAHQFVGLNLFFAIALPASWTVDFNADGELVNRYLGFSNTSPIGIPTDSNAFTGTTGFTVNWQPDFMTLVFGGDYCYSQVDTQNVFTNHRLNFDITASVPIKDVLTVSGKVGLVYTEDLRVPVLVPFSILADFTQPYMNLSVSGGMKTGQTDSADLQKRYPFVHFQSAMYEQAEWFAKIDSIIPFLKNYTFNTTFNFENTAFDQGRLLPDYDTENPLTAMYYFSLKNLLIFDSDLSISAQFDIFGLSVGWNAAWLDVLPEEHAHEIYLTGSVVSKKGLWGVELNITEAFSGDYVPNIRASTFYNIAPSFQIELKLEDAVKLFSGTVRTLAGHFVTDSGSVALLAKLYF